jgi:hypothetical protein
MAPAIRTVKDLRRNVRVLAAFPPNRNSSALRRLCDATIPIGMAKIRQSQLPETVMVDGRSYTRPLHWKR